MEDFETLSEIQIRRKIYAMIVPITLESILQMSSGIVAMGMIGRIDTASIAAVGLSTRITQLIWALFRGVSTGATVFAAKAYGANDQAKLKKITQQTLLSAFLVVLVFQQIVFWQAPALLSIFGKNHGLLKESAHYLRIVSWGLPFLAISLVITGILQGMGNAKTPMKISVIMNIVNIIMSYLFIFGGLSIPPLGLRGAALATVLSQMVAASIGLYILFNRNGMMASLFSTSFFQLDLKEVTAIYRVGSPTSMEAIFWQISAIVLTKIILSFGEVALAAYQLGFQAEAISYMPAMGFGVAATAFVGQALGAGDSHLAQRYLKEIKRGTVLITLIPALLLVFFPSGIMRLLTDQREVIGIGALYLFFMGLVQIPQNISGVLNGSLRGAGFTKVPMQVAGVGIWGIRIPLAYILTTYVGFSVTAVWAAMAIDLVIRFFLSSYLFNRKAPFLKAKPILVEWE